MKRFNATVIPSRAHPTKYLVRAVHKTHARNMSYTTLQKIFRLTQCPSNPGRHRHVYAYGSNGISLSRLFIAQIRTKTLTTPPTVIRLAFPFRVDCAVAYPLQATAQPANTHACVMDDNRLQSTQPPICWRTRSRSCLYIRSSNSILHPASSTNVSECRYTLETLRYMRCIGIRTLRNLQSYFRIRGREMTRTRGGQCCYSIPGWQACVGIWRAKNADVMAHSLQ